MRALSHLLSGLSESDISPGRVDAHTHDFPSLTWVRNGAITFTAENVEQQVPAGKAIWVPAGVEHGLRTEQGTVTVPAAIHMRKRQAELSRVRVVDIPLGWGDWLTQKWDSYLTAENTPLLDMVVGHSHHSDSPAPLPRLPMPRSPEAHAVARFLLRTPGSPQGVAELAAEQRVSAKTLQRQFAGETGIMFSEWRTRVRVRAAAARLADGHQIASTRRHVGYSTATGFTRAFQRHLGLTPREYVNRAGSLGSLAGVDEITSGVTALLTDEWPSPPPIPPYSGPMRVNDCHALLWIYRGEGTIRIGNRDWHLTRGDTIWVPAGLSHQVELAGESTLRVLGVRYGRVRTSIDDLRVFSFPYEAESYLLHVASAEFGPLRPDDPPTLVDDLFAEQFRRAIPGDERLTGAIGTIAAALRRDPADPRSLAEWAKALDTTPTVLGRQFTAQTGASFPRWRAQVRMNIARDLLFMGERPSIIARKLGYARPDSFTKVFTAAHGIPPREYVHRETGQLAGDPDHGAPTQPAA